MKQTTLAKILAVACSLGVVTAMAQTSTTVTTKDAAAGTTVTETSTSTVSGSGTITTYTPGSDYITFRSETSAEPVKYYYTKKTVLVDPSGRTVEWSALKPDMPVTYTYVKEGDRMVVSKITLAKPIVTEKETTTTTTTQRP